METNEIICHDKYTGFLLTMYMQRKIARCKALFTRTDTEIDRNSARLKF